MTRNRCISISLFSLLFFSFLHLGMARHGQYDEEARRQEKETKELAKQEKHKKGLADGPKGIISGVKQATVDSTTGFISETASGGASSNPVTGTIEGAQKGSAAFLDNTVKGVAKVATLGYGEVDNYTVEEPEAKSGEPTKIKIKIPGT